MRLGKLLSVGEAADDEAATHEAAPAGATAAQEVHPVQDQPVRAGAGGPAAGR